MNEWKLLYGIPLSEYTLLLLFMDTSVMSAAVTDDAEINIVVCTPWGLYAGSQCQSSVLSAQISTISMAIGTFLRVATVGMEPKGVERKS